MKKNPFLTFVFALIPGAGQMYHYYMKRGVSLMLAFCVGIALTAIISIFGFLLPVIWAYSFFDTFRLRNELLAGTARPDAFPFGLEEGESGALAKLIAKRHVFIGWALMILGAWLVFDRFILGTLRSLFANINFWFGYDLLSALPTLIVALALVALGVFLLRGRTDGHDGQDQQEQFLEYRGDDHE